MGDGEGRQSVWRVAVGRLVGLDGPDWRWYDRKARARKKRDPVRAERIYERGLARFPDEPWLLNNYAVLISGGDRPEVEEQLLRRALELDPDCSDALVNLARVRWKRLGDPGSARAMLEERIDRRSDDATALGFLALLVYQVDGDRHRSRDLFERSLVANPASVRYLINYASLLHNEFGEHDRAGELYELALARRPRDAHALSSYATFVALTRHDLVAADDLHRRALAAGRRDPIVLSNYARFVSDAWGYHDQARQLYEQALSIDPDDTTRLNGYAALLADRFGEHEQARAILERAVLLEPNNTVSLGSLATRCFLDHDDDRAEELFERVLADGCRNVAVLNNGGAFFLTRRRDPVRARLYFEVALLAGDDGSWPVAVVLGNLGGLLLAGGDDSGWELIDRCRSHPTYLAPEVAAVRAEVAFTVASVMPLGDPASTAALVDLRRELEGGARSIGWGLELFVDRARRDGRPDEQVHLLESLAAVMVDRFPLSTLERHAAWVALPPPAP